MGTWTGEPCSCTTSPFSPPFPPDALTSGASPAGMSRWVWPCPGAPVPPGVAGTGDYTALPGLLGPLFPWASCPIRQHRDELPVGCCGGPGSSRTWCDSGSPICPCCSCRASSFGQRQALLSHKLTCVCLYFYAYIYIYMYFYV